MANPKKKNQRRKPLRTLLDILGKTPLSQTALIESGLRRFPGVSRVANPVLDLKNKIITKGTLRGVDLVRKGIDKGRGTVRPLKPKTKSQQVNKRQPTRKSSPAAKAGVRTGNNNLSKLVKAINK
jgi:hypothetical protein